MGRAFSSFNLALRRANLYVSIASSIERSPVRSRSIQFARIIFSIFCSACGVKYGTKSSVKAKPQLGAYCYIVVEWISSNIFIVRFKVSIVGSNANETRTNTRRFKRMFTIKTCHTFRINRFNLHNRSPSTNN